MVILQLDKEQLFDLIENAIRKAIAEHDVLQEKASPIPKIMSLTEFCDHTGLSRQTAYKLTSAQKVPHSKRGKRLYFDREKVDAWLLENQVGTQSDIHSKAKDYLSKSQQRRRM